MEVGPQFFPSLTSIGICLQIDLSILHHPPLPLHHDVDLVLALAVVADFHRLVLKYLRKLLVGELAPLVGVEHL